MKVRVFLNKIEDSKSILNKLENSDINDAQYEIYRTQEKFRTHA